ncbi:protein transport protein bet1 [Coemansia javaensis]|uniref:Protein transport protein bet1 n=1 Tax=Coemansia javaensis TaxID=2761396 RepID=A0A9W8HDD7_9FUNG|nr:protein transport protein bet1 [Coemansia javaensis]
MASNRQRHPAGGGYRSYGGGEAGVEHEDDPNSKDTRLRGKIAMLKEVSISIGDEIRDQNQFLATMGQDMEGMGGRLGATMKQFYAMWARQGCGPLLYLLLFTIAVFVFLYLYLKLR